MCRRNQLLGTRPDYRAPILPSMSEEGYLDDRRVLVLRLSRADGRRCTAETDHDEIVKLMVGAESVAA